MPVQTANTVPSDSIHTPGYPLTSGSTNTYNAAECPFDLPPPNLYPPPANQYSYSPALPPDFNYVYGPTDSVLRVPHSRYGQAGSTNSYNVGEVRRNDFGSYQPTGVDQPNQFNTNPPNSHSQGSQAVDITLLTSSRPAESPSFGSKENSFMGAEGFLPEI